MGLDYLTEENLNILAERGLITPETLALAQSRIQPAVPVENLEVFPDERGFNSQPDENLTPVDVMPVPVVTQNEITQPVISDSEEIQGKMHTPVMPETQEFRSEIDTPVMPETQEFRSEIDTPVNPVLDPSGRYSKEIAARKELAPVIRDATALKGDIAGIRAGGEEREARAAEERERDLQTIFAERDQAINNAVQESREEFEKYKKMDINDFWANRSTGQKVMALIGIGLGGFRGGTNTAFQIVKKAMDDDYRLQKAAIDRQFLAYKGTKANLSELQDLYQDKIKSLDLMNLARLTKIKERVDAKVSGLGSESARIKGNELLANLDIEIAKASDKGFRETQEAISKRLAKSASLKEMTPYQKWQIGRDTEERNVSGYGVARSKTEARQFREVVATTADITQSIDRMLKLGDGINVWSRDRLAKLQTEQAGLVGKLRIPFTGGGVLSDGERAMLLDAIGDPGKFFSTEGIQSGRLLTLKTIINKGMENKARQVIIDYAGKQEPKKERPEVTPEDMESYDWAKNNMDDPRALKILELLKKKYQE